MKRAGHHEETLQGWKERRVFQHLLFLAILVASVCLALPDLREMSPTSDEWAHFLRGVAWWTTGDTRLSYAHPPLANVIATTPVAWEGALGDITEFRAYSEGSIIPLYEEYFSIDYGAAREQLLLARRMMLIFLVGTLIYAYRFVDQFFGWRAAIATVVLIGFNPTVLAHSRVVTTDMPAAFAFVVAIGEFVRYLTGNGTSKGAVRLALAFSWAILTKHNGLLLIPILGGLGTIAAVRRWGFFSTIAARRRRIRRLLVHVAIVVAISLVAVNAAYRFQRTMWSVKQVLDHPEPQYWISRPYEQQLLERWTILDNLPQSVRVPLPYTYIFGVACMAAQNARGWPYPYFLGQRGHRHGTWPYFPILLLTKNPVATVLLVLFGAAMVIRLRPSPSLPVTVLGLALGAFIVSISRSNLNMGVRHALPAVPLMSILAAVAFWEFWRRASSLELGDRMRRCALAALLVSTPVEATMACPLYLGYFNFFVGRELGHRISIIGEDWGQDIYQLAEFVRRRALRPIQIVEHTRVNRAELKWLRVDYVPMRCADSPSPGSWAVIRAAVALTRPLNCHVWVDDHEPVVTINNHILLYWIPPPPTLHHQPTEDDRDSPARAPSA